MKHQRSGTVQEKGLQQMKADTIFCYYMNKCITRGIAKSLHVYSNMIPITTGWGQALHYSLFIINIVKWLQSVVIAPTAACTRSYDNSDVLGIRSCRKSHKRSALVRLRWQYSMERESAWLTNMQQIHSRSPFWIVSTACSVSWSQ